MTGTSPAIRFRTAGQLAAIGLIPILIASSFVVVPAGQAGVRISQLSGTLPGTLYPGMHFVLPLVEHVELLNTRDYVYTTALADDPKQKTGTLRVQTKEGLPVGLAVTIRFKLDAARLPYIYSNLPQPVEQEIVPPVIASAFREAAPNYTVRELFATRRDEIARSVAGEITRKLAVDGVVVKEVMLRDILLPAEYAKGMEGLLLKEQENERLDDRTGRQAEDGEGSGTGSRRGEGARDQASRSAGAGDGAAGQGAGRRDAAHAAAQGEADPAVAARG